MDLEQNKVIEFKKGAAVVFAGAGSGKTSTLIGRIKNLAEEVNPKRIVMLTFTNAAADEMKDRASKVNDKCKEVIACTYHKYCGRLLRSYGRSVGIEPTFEVLTETKYKTLIEYVKSQNEKYEELKDFPSATKLQSIFSYLTNNDDVTLREVIMATKYHRYEEEIQELWDEVKAYGLRNQKFSFDDLLVYTNKILDDPNICQRIATSFDYLMVDEFQDTNKLQLDILIKLGKYNNNIVIVGDISQSIYKFRGARVQNLDSFVRAFKDCKLFTMSTNYRSTQEILDAANCMMNNWAKWKYTNMKANNKHGEKPYMVKHESDTAQAQWILNRIYKWGNTGVPLNQIAIIVRKSMSSFKLENELTKAHLPFEKRGGMKFTEYACVDDVLSFLSVLSKNDKFSWFNVLRLVPGVGNKTASDIAEHCTEEHFFDRYEKRAFYINLKSLEAHMSKFATENLDLLFDQVSEYYFDLRAQNIENSKMKSSAKFDAYEKLERDKKVISVLKDMANGYKSISDFLEDIALDSVKKDDDEDKDKLIITTIHSAKGLEWDKVIIMDCVESDNLEDVYEELRCMYVAMTRAKNEMYLSIPQVSFVNGSLHYNDFIRFLDGTDKYFNKIRG